MSFVNVSRKLKTLATAKSWDSSPLGSYNTIIQSNVRSFTSVVSRSSSILNLTSSISSGFRPQTLQKWHFEQIVNDSHALHSVHLPQAEKEVHWQICSQFKHFVSFSVNQQHASVRIGYFQKKRRRRNRSLLEGDGRNDAQLK